MAHFIGAGIISTDITRKETTNGVLAIFRLAAGERGHGQVWIDVEAWGNLAGTTYQHGAKGRGVLVAGRLTLKTWQHPSTGASHSRYVITANEIDLLPDDLQVEDGLHCTNAVTLAGHIDSPTATRTAGTGRVTEFRIASGKARSKSGRLWIDVELWHRADQPIHVAERDHVAVNGRLAFNKRADSNGEPHGRYYINARDLHALHPRSDATSSAGGSTYQDAF